MVITAVIPLVLDRVRFNAGESFDAPGPIAERLIAIGQARLHLLDGPPASKIVRAASRKQAPVGEARGTLEDR